MNVILIRRTSRDMSRANKANRHAPGEWRSTRIDDSAGRNDRSEVSTTTSWPSASEDISSELNVSLPKWFAKIRQVCDRVIGVPQITRDRAFRNGDSELQQLAVDPRSAPETILRGQAPNQIST